MRTRHIVGTVLVGIVALLVGYVMGFRTAWPMGVQAEFAARGVLATQMLQALRNGKTEFIIMVLEGDVDSALLIGGDFAESSARPLLPAMGVAGPADYDEFMSRTANYRKANPREIPTGDADIKRVLSERINRYAK
jgi:hypothetical protein